MYKGVYKNKYLYMTRWQTLMRKLEVECCLVLSWDMERKLDKGRKMLKISLSYPMISEIENKY